MGASEKDFAAAPAGVITTLLLQWRGGDDSALHRLIPLVHGELRRIARNCMRGERAEITLQPTALVHEAYIRLVRGEPIEWRNRIHFFAVAARVMRNVLVDEARKRATRKHGGEHTWVAFDEGKMVPPGSAIDVRALDEALVALAAEFPRKAQVIELRFFGGLTIEQTAVALDISVDIVKREWRTARPWLRRAMEAREHEVERHGPDAVAAR